MKKKYFLFLLILLLIPIGITHALSDNISGTIKDSNNNSVITKIELVNSTHNEYYNTITSRIDGSFSLNVNSGSYTLKFSSINQTNNMPRFFEVEKPVTISGNLSPNIVPPIATITVNIKDSSGNNIQGAILDSGVGKITLGGYDGTEEDLGTTDSNGNVVLHLLPATFTSVKIILPNGQVFFPSSGRTVTISDNQNFNIQIPSNPTVSGTIKDNSGNPVRTIIELVGNDYVERTSTDQAGSYSFSVPSGDYILKFSQLFTNQTNIPKYFDAEKQVTITSSSTQNLIAPIISVSGQINQTSMPIKVREALNNGGFTGFSLDDVITDSSGHFNAKLIQSNDNHVTIQVNGTGRFFSCTLSGSNIVC